jgi:hypothetical protein
METEAESVRGLDDDGKAEEAEGGSSDDEVAVTRALLGIVGSRKVCRRCMVRCCRRTRLSGQLTLGGTDLLAAIHLPGHFCCLMCLYSG